MNNLTPLNDRRYIVGYELSEVTSRVVVFVVDKWAHKIIYKSIVKERQKAYPSIQRIYGKDHCIPPKPIPLALFE